MFAVYLYPKGAYRTQLRSDTLWGLLMVAARAVYGSKKVEDFIAATIQGDAPFVVSSAFPFFKKDEVFTHFFPKPLFNTKFEQAKDLYEVANFKKYKKIKWIDEIVFADFLNGRTEKDLFLSDLSKKQAMNLTKRSLELHTSIDPLSGTTRKIEGQGQLYWSETFFMERNAGLFFLVKGNDFLEWEGALRFLTDFGFGGDNSSGKGFFDYQIKPFDINTPENARHSVLLSLYNPTAIELGQIKEMSTETTYELITRKGKIGTHFNNTGNFQKDAIISFTEGSVIPVVNPTGRLQVVAQSPQHPIYHNSLAFSFPIALNA